MTMEQRTTKGLGHHVGRIVSRWDILQKYPLALDGLANEVILDPDVPGAEGCLGGCGNGHADLIVLSHEGWTGRGMTRLC